MARKKRTYEQKTRREKQTEFRSHLRTYLVMCACFVVLNLLTIGSIGWAIWPILGWGIGITMQAMSLYGPLADPEEDYPRERDGRTPMPDLEDERMELRELERRPYRDEDLV